MQQLEIVACRFLNNVFSLNLSLYGDNKGYVLKKKTLRSATIQLDLHCRPGRRQSTRDHPITDLHLNSQCFPSPKNKWYLNHINK